MIGAVLLCFTSAMLIGQSAGYKMAKGKVIGHLHWTSAQNACLHILAAGAAESYKKRADKKGILNRPKYLIPISIIFFKFSLFYKH